MLLAYIKVAQVAKERGSILEKRSQLFRSHVALRYQGVPFAITSMVEIHDEVEDVGAFWRHLPHNDSASMPCCTCKVMGIELLAPVEGIEDSLNLELMDCSARRRSVGALGRRHGDETAESNCDEAEQESFRARNGESCAVVPNRDVPTWQRPA